MEGNSSEQFSGNNKECILETQLREYVLKGLYPFHMPGHKRLMAPAPSLPYDWDMTEVEGVDDLHHSEGILKKAMERTADLFGAEYTRYLVNGSTVGLLAGIRAAVPYGCEIAAARNCHKAVYHAIELMGLKVNWLFPKVAGDGIQCSIEPEAVSEVLENHSGIRLLVITSPTYEGVVSDIRKIADICHSKNVTLLVDEAHGAHLGLERSVHDRDSFFPDSSIHQGADIVVQSPHKTLPSLTQTALLHLPFGSRVKIEDIECELDVFETSSPSYPLMASLDGCTGIIRNHGTELYLQWKERLQRFDRRIQALNKLKVICHGNDSKETHKDFYAFDPGKIVIEAENSRLTGADLAAILREKYGMETEMHLGDYVLAMTSMCDSEDALDNLADALLKIDAALSADDSEAVGIGRDKSQINGKRQDNSEYKPDAATPATTMDSLTLESTMNASTEMAPMTMALMTIKEALERECITCSRKEAKGAVAGEYVYCYPPGIPIIVPGEVITARELDMLEILEKKGCRVFHSGSRKYTDAENGEEQSCFVIVSDSSETVRS